MKNALLLFFALTASLLSAQEKSTSGHEVGIGYNTSYLGQSLNLNYGYRFNNNRVYGGMRFQLNAPFHSYLFTPNVSQFDFDQGSRFGGNLGYERMFKLSHSRITPLVGIGLQYSYLNTRFFHREEDPLTGKPAYQVKEQEAIRRFLPTLYMGFEAQLHKNLYIKPTIGINTRTNYLLRPENFTGNIGINYRF